MAIEEVFSRFPELETPNLLLRQTCLSDAEAMFVVFSDEETMYYYGMLPHKTVEDSAELVRMQEQWFANRQGIRWGITHKSNDTYLGSCGFHNFDEGFRRAEIGYELNKAYWRQGITSEALRAIITFGFEEMGLNRIEAVVDEDNERSKNLLRKLGFTYEGCTRKRFYFRERFWDEHWFGLLRDEYEQGRLG